MTELGHKTPNLDNDSVRRTDRSRGKRPPEGQLIIGQEVPGTIIEPTVELTSRTAPKTAGELLPTGEEADRIHAATDRLSGPEARIETIGVDRNRYVEATTGLARISKHEAQRLEREEAESEASAERTQELLRSTFLPEDQTQPPKPNDQAA